MVDPCVPRFSYRIGEFALFCSLNWLLTKRLCCAKLPVKIAFCAKAISTRQFSRPARAYKNEETGLRSNKPCSHVIWPLIQLWPSFQGSKFWQERGKRKQCECFERAQITSWNVVGYPPNFCVLPLKILRGWINGFTIEFINLAVSFMGIV